MPPSRPRPRVDLPPTSLRARLFAAPPASPPGGALGQAIVAAAARRRALALDPSTTAFRVVHHGETPLDGLAVDVYGDHAVAHFSSAEANDESTRVARLLVDLGFTGVYAKFRPRQASTLADTRRDDVAPPAPIAGDPAPEVFPVLENGDPFLVRLGDGLSTGIFLDQRANRARVRSLSGNARVLNLFAYACAFSVSAVSGGAQAVISVDISRAALAQGEANLQHLASRTDPPLDLSRHRFIADEAMTFLRRCAVRGDRYDLVLLDPPSFASTKTTRFTAEHDYVALATAALTVLAPGGSLLACTNHQGIRPPRFRGFLEESVDRARRSARSLSLLAPPSDFPAPPGTEPHLKSMLVTLS